MLGKTALITGGSRGIGKTIAIKLADKGFNIALNYRTYNEDVENLLKEIEQKGVKALGIKCDVSNFEETKKMIEECAEKLGSLDVLVNNAGITKDNLLLKMKESDFDSVININLKGAFNCTKHASAVMLKQKSGKIINISSVIGVVGNAGQANYAASKAGIIGLTKSAAKELASRGITVNAVAPGFIQSDMTAVLNEKTVESIKSNIPLKKLGTAGDVANVVAFLSSDEAQYITGQVINVDGGMVM